MATASQTIRSWGPLPGHGCACDLCREPDDEPTTPQLEPARPAAVTPVRQGGHAVTVEDQDAVFARELPCY